jgi:hypothetical protein
MEPAHASDQSGGEFHAIGVYCKAPLIDLAEPGNNVQVAAWRLGEKDISVIVLNLIKAAEAATVAELFPSLFIIFAVLHWLKPLFDARVIASPRNHFLLLFQSSCR